MSAGIDIIMATMNGRQYLKEQLESLLGQSFTDFRLLVRDDASSDGTAELLNMYAALYPDKIKLVGDGTASGAAKNNFFLLLKETDAEYVMFCDQDDVWEKEKVEKAYHFIRQKEKKAGHDRPLLCHGDPKVADEKLNVTGGSMFEMQKLDGRKRKFRDYLVQNNVTGCTMIINRRLADMCCEMPEGAIMHDWWLALIASAFGRVCFMGSVPMLYRQHPNNTEGVKNLKSPFYVMKKMFDRKSAKNALKLTYRQAESFDEVFGDRLAAREKEVLAAFRSLEKKNKFARLFTMIKYKFRKSGGSRELGYIFYC